MTSPISMLLSVTLTMVAAAHSMAGETLSNSQLGMQITIPDGFVELSGEAKDDTVYAFHRPADDKKPAIYLQVRRLGGALERKRLDAFDLAVQSPGATLDLENWNGYEIQIFRVPEEEEDEDGKPVKYVTFNAPLPLIPEAVSVDVSGEAAHEQEIRSVLRQVLGTVRGQAGSYDTFTTAFRAVQRIGGWVAILIFFFVGNAIVRRIRKSKAAANPA